MPYTEHPLFTSPPDSDFRLWRYMDFTKFVSLLNKKALFFPKGRILRKIDKWEGIWLQKELDSIYDWMKEVYTKNGDENPIARANEFAKGQTAGDENALDETFISCWHINNVESAAMWRLYIKNYEGVAIKTTVNNFKNCFKDYKRDVCIGQVRYKDYLKDIYSSKDFNAQSWNGFLPYIHKRNNYEYEHEYRAIVWTPNKDILEEHTEDGIFVPVDIDMLIEAVYVSPSAPDWFLNLVKDTLKQFGINKPVLRSEMDDETCTFKSIGSA